MTNDSHIPSERQNLSSPVGPAPEFRWSLTPAGKQRLLDEWADRKHRGETEEAIFDRAGLPKLTPAEREQFIAQLECEKEGDCAESLRPRASPPSLPGKSQDFATPERFVADTVHGPAELAGVLHAATPTAIVICWRCGKSTPANSSCLWCHAQVQAGAASITSTAPVNQCKPVLRLIASYAILLGCAAAFGVVAYLLDDEGTRHARHHSLYSFSLGEAILETVWTVVVLVAVRTSPRPPPLETFGAHTRSLGWALALPTLGLCLAANFAYHQALLQYVGESGTDIDVAPSSPLGAGEILFATLTVCVQPGIIEELFFRYLALGTLRTVMGRHAAVVVSSVMFGVAHVHSPLSIPILVVVGLGLGYVRLLSGNLILPMLLHALHNGVVLWWELTT